MPRPVKSIREAIIQWRFPGQTLDLASLGQCEAVAFFVDRAEAVIADFTLVAEGNVDPHLNAHAKDMLARALILTGDRTLLRASLALHRVTRANIRTAHALEVGARIAAMGATSIVSCPAAVIA